MRKKIFSPALLMVAAVSLVSCSKYWLHNVYAQKGLSGVARELTPDGSVQAAALRAKSSPIGEGMFVYPADVLQRGQPAIVWLIKGGKPYALNQAARTLTPRLRDAREIPNEFLTAEEQSSELEALVWVSLSRMVDDKRREYRLEMP